MNNHGFSHVNLATLDLDATRDFYEGMLGFEVVAAGIYEVSEGGRFRHAYFNVGNGHLLSFIEPRAIPGVSESFETAINPALGVPPVFYHFAFEAGSPEELDAKREELLDRGVPVTEVVDHDWCHSIYFDDPVNGLKLEYACYTRELTEEDAEMAVRFEIPLAGVRALGQTE
ncbi:MAG: VOC family protein [Candidatus Promineifilaceae bacterium]|nr:VOC family protein [Candidatus Promineifilaceae bacterium]